MEEVIDAIETDLREKLERWMMGPRLPDCGAEDVVTIYGALSTYLKILVQQPEEDLETIARVTRLLIEIKPQAVEASQEIAGRRNDGD